MDITDRINQLAKDFHNQIKDIQTLRSHNSDSEHLHYRKTLLITLIDCLANIRFDKTNYPSLNKQNRKRLIKLIKEYGNWSDGSLVSIPFLKSRLEKKNLKGQLFERICALLNRYDPDAGNSIQLSAMDKLPEELTPFASSTLEKKQIYRVQHYCLFYHYRNNLVHEFCKPGNAMECFAEGTRKSCYHSYIGDKNYHLVYPVELFEDIAKSAVDGIKNYFLEKQINPDDRIGDTTRW